MFSVAFFSLASLALSALASPLAHNHVRETVELEVDGGKAVHDKAWDTVATVPHVRRHDPAHDLSVFIGNFGVSLTKLESIVNGAADVKASAPEMRLALGDLVTPMTEFVGVIMTRSGVSVQEGNHVAVDVDQTVLTVEGYATRLNTCLSKVSSMVGDELEYSDIKMATRTAGAMFSAVVTSIATVHGFALNLITPLLVSATSLVNNLGVCATSTLGL